MVAVVTVVKEGAAVGITLVCCCGVAIMRFTGFMAGPLDVWVDEANDAAGVAMV